MQTSALSCRKRRIGQVLLIPCSHGMEVRANLPNAGPALQDVKDLRGLLLRYLPRRRINLEVNASVRAWIRPGDEAFG